MPTARRFPAEHPLSRRLPHWEWNPALPKATVTQPVEFAVEREALVPARVELAPKAILLDNPGVGPTMFRGCRAALLLWAFYLGAQLGSEPPENGLVATATQAACEAARFGVVELARASGTTVELGVCRELSPDDLRRPRSHGARSETASPPTQDRDSQGAPAVRRPSNVRCLSRDSCKERF